MSDNTSASLLDCLRQQPDAGAWQRLVDLYDPLIRHWLRRHNLLPQDADDVVQEVLTVVVRKIAEFRKEPRAGAFRRWLKNITINCVRDHWRARNKGPAGTGDSDVLQILNQLEDPHSALSREWDLEHDRHVTARLLQLIEPHFEAKTWQAFRRLAVDGAAPDAVAAELGISVNAVFIAKSRVLSRLRQEGEGLLD